MEKLAGVNIPGNIVPGTADDSYATHDSFYGRGGWREVASTTERDAITDDRLRIGMAVYVTGTNQVYIYKGEVENPYTHVKTKQWTEFSGGGGSGGSGSGRNIGDIFYTTRKDTSLSGAVECNGGTYSTADYTGAGSIGELLKAGKLPYVSLTEYANKISTDGVCGVFGWNGGASTSFRVPLLKDVFVEAAPLSENQHGWHIAAGLPDHRHSLVTKNQTMPWAGNNGVVWYAETTGYTGYASADNPIYGRSNTVQPEAVKYRAMVQLFTGTTDEAVAIVGTVVAEVANRVIKGHELIDFQVPTADNGYTWYRKYADGWVEQGGILTQAANTSFTATITFPIAMADNNYCILFAGRGSNNTTAGNFAGVQYTNETTTSVGVYVGNDNTRYTKLCWQVSGVAK